MSPKIKKRLLVDRVFNEIKRKTNWSYSGGVLRFKQIFLKELSKKPLDYLTSLKNKKPDVIFVGPGKGLYIHSFKNFLEHKKIYPKVDVLSLKQGNVHHSLIKEKNINKELTFNSAIENIDVFNKKHIDLIKKIQGKYNLVMSEKSASTHTVYPAYNTFQTSLMLKKGGRAYVEIRNFNTYKALFNNVDSKKVFSEFKKLFDIKDYSKREKEYLKLFNKRYNSFLTKYNKLNKSSFKFDINVVSKTSNTYFLEIKRIN